MASDDLVHTWPVSKAVRAVSPSRSLRCIRLARPTADLHPATAADAYGRVLELASTGAPVEEIAARASLSPGTVRNYLSNAMTKLDAANRHDACVIARRLGWI